MTKKLIGIVPKIEVRQLQLFIERKNSLDELKIILNWPHDSKTIKRVDLELEDIECKISKWWAKTLDIFNKSAQNNSQYEINYFTCELFLICE